MVGLDRRGRFSSRATVVASVLLAGIALGAQGAGSVEGTVTDSTGAALAGARVSLVTTDDRLAAAASTDGRGDYRVDGLAPGIYRVRVERTGFVPVTTEPLEVAAGETRRRDAVLDVAAFGEALVVTATRGEETAVSVPASVTSASMDRLYANGFFVAADELRGQPGFSFRRAEGDNDDFLIVSTRGVNGNAGNDAFLALVDGIPFVGGDEEVTMGDVPYAAVDRIEMVRGPVSALYGRGGIAGAINYLTLSPSGNDARARASVGSDTFLNGDLRLGRAAGRHQFLVALNGTYSEGWREQNDRKIANVFAKDIVRLGSSAALTLWANYLDKDTATGSVIPLRADGTRLPTIGGREGFFGTGDIGQQRRLFWSAARFEQSPSSGVSWSATAHYRRLAQNGRFDFYDPFGFRESEGIVTLNGFENESLEHTAFVEGQAIVGRLGPARIVAGANYERVTVDEDEFWTGQFGFTFECGFAFFAVEFDAATGRILNRDHPCFVERLLRASSEATNQFASGFAQAEIALGARATVTLGGRYDRFSRNVDITAGTPLFDNLPFDRTLDNFSPKAALSVSYAPNQYAYASFGEGFNSNFGPVWQWDPSLYIRREQPTTLRNYEGGVKGMLLANRLSYALSVYAIRQKDRLVFTTNPAAETDFTAPPNIATTGQRYHTEGLELTMRARPARRTIVDGSYGYTRAKWEELIIETFGPPIDLSGKNAVGVPAHAVSLGVDQQLTDALSARLWWEYYGDYFYTQDNQFKGGQYDLFNLGVTWRPRAWGVSQVNLSVTNLLDEEYYFLFGSRDAPTYAVPGVPIQARVSVDWQF